MAPARRNRSRTQQPKLPLPDAEAAPAGTGVRGGSRTDWRLDEHTRQVGRQGIAAARAQLAATGAGVNDADAADDRTERAA